MEFYTESQKKLQKQFDSLALAQRVQETIVSEQLDDMHRSFIESRDFFFLSTVNAEGSPTVSYKGGDPGVVSVLDPTTIVFQNYDGNGMFLSMGNIEDTAKIGLLFIDFVTPNRIRVQATATISSQDPMMSRYPGANMIVRARVDKVFLNCARYIHKHARIESSAYVPDSAGEAPYPSWKRIDLLQDALRPQDRGRAQEQGGIITMDDYAKKLEAGDS